VHALPSILGLLVSASLLAPLTAQAQQPPPAVSERDIKARELFEKGREAYSDGRYRDAWANFHDAYQLSGRPELLFNIGQTADRLGQENDAVKAFSMYLERLPAAPNRRDVENRVRALQDRLAATQAPAPVAASPARPTPAPQPAAPAATPAREPLPNPPTIAPPPREPRRGFYLHAAVGVGYRNDSFTRNIEGSSFLDPSSSTDYGSSGFGPTLDLGLGWGVLPGFAVGGGVFLDWTSAPKLSEADGTESDLAFARLTTIGPFVDWYPIRKTLGLYVMAGFGLSVLSYKNADGNARGFDGDAYGFGVHLGAGYEFNLSRTVALGVGVRFMTAVLAEAVESQTTSHVLTSPSLIASFTWF
jgi:opacity protein-like surface antigen